MMLMEEEEEEVNGESEDNSIRGSSDVPHIYTMYAGTYVAS